MVTPLVQPHSLGGYIGQGIDASFQSIQFLVAEGLKNDVGDSLMPGRFLIALRSRSSSAAIGKPSHDALLTDRLYLVRIADVHRVPDSGAIGELSQRIMDKRMAEMASLSGQTPDGLLERHFFNVIECTVVGSFTSGDKGQLYFAGDVGHIAPAVSYHLYTPDTDLMQLIINGTLTPDNRIDFGLLRVSENFDYVNDALPAMISMNDIRGKRTAMFGKTRMGKSNTVKLVVQGMLDATTQNRNVGQLIFDVNGEYANSNPQDGNEAIATAYADRCTSYFLSNRGGNPNAHLLRFNFYERTNEALAVMKELLPPDVASSEYVSTLLTVRLPSLGRSEYDTDTQVLRRVRKIMLFWTLLDACGFDADADRLRELLTNLGVTQPFNPGFSQIMRMAAYQAIRSSAPPPQPSRLSEMVSEMNVIARFSKEYQNDPSLVKDGVFIFDGDEEIMVNFLLPPAGTGPYVLRPCLQYHSPTADDFVADVLSRLTQGDTVIIDLGSANEQIIRYFARSLSEAVFREQERKFVSNQLNGKYVQIYFEEAHMIFPPNSGNVIDVYSRFAKEGAKFNIGIVYSTQSPSTVNRDLLAQTENFFIGHLSSVRETVQLGEVQYAFKSVEERILKQRTPGLLHLLTYSHRYVIPVQANRYNGVSRLIR
ncbi:MAG: hypothetical protein RLZZ24_1511 [Pseudomonadota bacterium]